MKVLMLGFGVVGRSVAEFIANHTSSSLGLGDVKVVGVSDTSGSIIDEKGINLRKAVEEKARKGSLIRSSFENKRPLSGEELIDLVQADVLVETTSTNISTGEPGLTHIQKALKNGLHVVTTNKGPLVISLPELKKAAEKNQLCLRYSGAVGGGTPILDFLDAVKPEGIQSLRGILNGTTNYIIWRMEKEGVALDTAIKKAKTLGYAEKDPSLDVKGLDTACKLVIIANHLGWKKQLHEAHIEGIEALKASDLLEAQRRGKVIRLIGALNNELKVSPEEIPIGDALHIEGNLNGLTVKTKLGVQTIIGTGAGGRATAASVIRDLLFIARRARKKAAITQVAVK